MQIPLNEKSKISKVIAIMSGKGGVGKSFVTASMAVQLARQGKKVGILDADVTGPSIPKMFGINKMAESDGEILYPQMSAKGIKIISVNVLLDNPEEPVIWRGPIISNVVKQFWSEVCWGELDVLLIDMPPGTGDVSLTVFQSIPVDGGIIVTSPQDLVKMIVKKAYNMAHRMNIPIVGLIENYSYIECPDCGKHIPVFGESKIDSISEEIGMEVLGKMPIMTSLAELADEGRFDEVDNEYVMKAVEKIM